MDNKLPIVEDLSELLLSGRPLLDLRSPSEFKLGHIPGSYNIPLLDDEQRIAVGTCYKQKGEAEALRLGAQLISGEVESERIDNWSRWANAHSDGVLFCWRGGLRSQLTQQALLDTGLSVPRALGGYQKLRQRLIQVFDDLPVGEGFGVVCGRTGTGKTEALLQLSCPIDLEGHANHKGSAFGKGATEQPTQVNFENLVALDLLQRDPSRVYWFEDESHLIGRCSLPLPLNDKLPSYPGVEIISTLEERTERLLKDYVLDRYAEYERAFGEFADEHYEASVLSQFDRIKKRLGGLRHSQLRVQVQSAMSDYRITGDPAVHSGWISYLLSDYYDPMYSWQQEKKGRKIEFQGLMHEVVEYCEHISNS